MKAAVVTGAVTPPGRLAAAAGAVARACEAGGAEVFPVELWRTSLPFADGRPEAEYDRATQDVIEGIGDADVVFFCSPVYRGTYPGVVKNLLDLLPLEALRDTPVGLVVVGGAPHHYLGVDAAMRSVLAWFGALPAPTSVYLTGRDFVDGRPTPDGVGELEELVTTARSLAEAVAGRTLGPAPLAARF